MKINPYKIRLVIAGIVGVLSILAVCGLFYPVKFMDIQFVPLLQRLFFDFSVITAVLFVGIIIGIFVGKKLWDKKKKKKRANELVDDDYEYDTKKEAINEN